MMAGNEAPPNAANQKHRGSRWAGLILLLVSAGIAVVFYLTGLANSKSWRPDFAGLFFGPAVYTVAK